MNQALKQRLVGAVVLLALGIIFLPGVLRENQQAPVNRQTLVPQAPDYQRLRFENPERPDNIKPAPDPETMFIPPSGQVPQDALEAVDIQPDADQSHQQASTDVKSKAPSETGEQEAQLQGAWVVQVASFRSAERASELRDKLQDQGYRAYIRSADTDSGLVNRVFIGPKIDKEAANQVKHAVDEAFQLNTLVLRFEP